MWAPNHGSVGLRLLDPLRSYEMKATARGWFHTIVEDAPPGTRYRYRLGDQELPDPASRWQPEGVHGPSAVVDDDFDWTDGAWFGRPMADLVIYELHVGTFTEAGTFDAVIDHLDSLVDLGITAVELMPVAQFPGDRNWGYDGVFPYAPQHSYGGPAGLRRLVDACHDRGLVVVLDVVYNHLGPEGCVHGLYGPYFTDTYRTPWGQAINFDQAGSDEVRDHFLGNALRWFEAFHVDALRLDAVHAILDTSALPFLELLAIETERLSERLNRRLHLIAESADNDARLITPRVLGGFGLDAQWNDDFHHALYSLVTGDRSGYYADYGTLRHLARGFRDGFVYQGEYSVHRGRRHGRSSRHRAAERFVVFTRNHDQIGNRMDGARLSTRLDHESQKLVAAVMLLSPYVPLLFMGEEYGETAPFLYFVSHTDPDLLEAVRRGRREEFAAFEWEGEPPDPAAEETFTRSTLDHALAEREPHRSIRDCYRELLRLRRDVPALQGSKDELEVVEDERAGLLMVRRWHEDDECIIIVNISDEPRDVSPTPVEGTWTLAFDSAAERWGGPSSTAPGTLHLEDTETVRVRPHSVVLYRTEVT